MYDSVTASSGERSTVACIDGQRARRRVAQTTSTVVARVYSRLGNRIHHRLQSSPSHRGSIACQINKGGLVLRMS